MQTVHLIIKGKVQGVFYRVSAKEKADELHITGWVKNTDDGNVEIIATADENNLEQFINWCYKGPARSKVIEIISALLTPQTFNTFSIIRG